jgi:hypothetical protein
MERNEASLLENQERTMKEKRKTIGSKLCFGYLAECSAEKRNQVLTKYTFYICNIGKLVPVLN